MDNQHLILVEQICTYHQAEPTFIGSLQELGLIEVVVIDDQQYLRDEQLQAVEKMIRLHYELHINPEGIDAIAHLLQRIDDLQQELTAAKNKLRLLE
jgi:hypothetical protein